LDFKFDLEIHEFIFWKYTPPPPTSMAVRKLADMIFEIKFGMVYQEKGLISKDKKKN
jgi:hypothetical protein